MCRYILSVHFSYTLWSVRFYSSNVLISIYKWQEYIINDFFKFIYQLNWFCYYLFINKFKLYIVLFLNIYLCLYL